jgi:hypothetical protein
MRESILEAYPEDEFLFALGLDDAIIGVEQFSMKVVYSEIECIRIYQEQGMSFEEAVDFFEFNVKSAYMGEKTPIFVDDTM